MKYLINPLVIIFALLVVASSSAHDQSNTVFKTPYGNNKAVGKYVSINGAKIYYEIYGKGDPLLLIHANSGSIRDMSHQIEYFKTKYKVVVADSRGHGKSGLNTHHLSYQQMAEDWDGLVKHLDLDPINIIGWSDGGIIGLIMGIEKRSKINKIVAMGANIRPDDTAVNSWASNIIKEREFKAKEMITKGDKSRDWSLALQLYGLLLYQPNIGHSDLKKIVAPVLIMAGDRDIIKNQHTLEIFENIPNAQLSIMPGETHFTPKSNPHLFNEIVDKFLTEKYTQPILQF